MPELATDDYQSVPIPRRVKISSKRQITIPVDVYERQGFTQYAMLTETPDGLIVQPVELTADDEELTLRLLKHLVDAGLEGDELIEQYEQLKPKYASYYKAIQSSEADIKAGRLVDFDEMQDRIRERHGL